MSLKVPCLGECGTWVGHGGELLCRACQQKAFDVAMIIEDTRLKALGAPAGLQSMWDGSLDNDLKLLELGRRAGL